MPGSPATTPNLGLPRYSNSDVVDFADQINAIVDLIDSEVGAQLSVSPLGAVQDYAGSGDPNTNWLICDGRAISRTTYATLYAKIGTTWGVGNGTTTFNIPDLRGRVTVGAGSGSGLTARTLAQTLGEETHQLSTGEMPTHSHTVNDPGHAHSLYIWVTGGPTNGSPSNGSPGIGWGLQTGVQYVNPINQWDVDVGVALTAPTGITLGNAGSGTAHNIMQPSAVLNKIIRVL
jgi:microcystin-dependent protein